MTDHTLIRRNTIALVPIALWLCGPLAAADDARALTLGDLAPRPAPSAAASASGARPAGARDVRGGDDDDSIDARHVVLDGVKMVRLESRAGTLYVPEFKDFSPEVLQQGLCGPATRGSPGTEVQAARAERPVTENLQAYAALIQKTVTVKCGTQEGPEISGTRGAPPKPEVGLSSTSTDKDGVEQEKKIYVRPRSAGVGMSF